MIVKVPPRTGILVLRAWVEGDAPGGLRARITQSRDLTTAEQLVTTASTIDHVLATVSDWLHALLVDQDPPNRAP